MFLNTCSAIGCAGWAGCAGACPACANASARKRAVATMPSTPMLTSTAAPKIVFFHLDDIRAAPLLSERVRMPARDAVLVVLLADVLHQLVAGRLQPGHERDRPRTRVSAGVVDRDL